MVLTGISNNPLSNSISPYNYGKQQDAPQSVSAQTSNKTKSKSDEASLTDEELKEIETLKERDAEVKAHELAHKTAGGQYAGAASYEYQTGPDGVRYAVGGEVPIDVSEIPDDPEATVTKMEVVQKAALAPVNPSAADRAIASSASMKETEARSEITKTALEDQQKGGSGTSANERYVELPSKGSGIDIKI